MLFSANVPIVLVQFLALAFFVVVGLGIALGWYAARSLKRAEALATAEAPAPVTTYESPAMTETVAESID